MKKVLVIGCCGSGKSTFSKRLSEKLNIEPIHLDQHYWRRNWEETSKEEWKEKVKKLVERDEWIMDGNYGGTFNIRFRKADTVFYLERSKWFCLYRVIKRVIKYKGHVRPDMVEGCEERFDWSFMKYVYSFNKYHKPIIDDYLMSFDGVKHVLKSDKECRMFLSNLK